MATYRKRWLDVKREDYEKALTVLDYHERRGDIDDCECEFMTDNGVKIVRFRFACICGDEDFEMVKNDLGEIVL